MSFGPTFAFKSHQMDYEMAQPQVQFVNCQQLMLNNPQNHGYIPERAVDMHAAELDVDERHSSQDTSFASCEEYATSRPANNAPGINNDYAAAVEDNCSNHRSMSTPPSSPERTETNINGGNGQGLPVPRSAAELFGATRIGQCTPRSAKLLLCQEKFHRRAIALRPDLPLAPHRYWIAVLNLDKKISTFSSGKHFVWMKGNRLTTVRTVWHAYQVANMEDNFTLMLGFEKVELTDQCEELDYFNDKFICFHAVKNEECEGRQRSWTDEVIPKDLEPGRVMELD